jgi:hypothetical protein
VRELLTKTNDYLIIPHMPFGAVVRIAMFGGGTRNPLMLSPNRGVTTRDKPYMGMWRVTSGG